MESEISEVERALAALYGARPLIARGVVHVCSAARASDGRLHALKVGERAPKSASDRFVLNLCRARSDALLTTAAILRAEPRLSHALRGPDAVALARYRRALGKTEAPCCAILTRSGELPAAHPVWDDGTRKLVLTSPEGARELRLPAGVAAEVLALADLDARRALALLRARGHALISVEAGPSTAGELYTGAPEPDVDELLLSLYEGLLPDDGLAGALPEDATLFGGRTCLADTVRNESSGRWHFQRWVCAIP